MLLLLAVSTLVAASNIIVLSPPAGKQDLPPVGFVIIQGAEIPPDAYVPLAKAVATAADYAVWVAIPPAPLNTPEPAVIGNQVKDGKSSLHAAGMPTGAPVVLGAHSLGGAMLQLHLANAPKGAAVAQVLMGAGIQRKFRVPTPSTGYPVPTLTLDGTLDGLFRVTRQAESYYHYVLHAPSHDEALKMFPVVVYEGVTHMQFASGPLPALVKKRDLEPTVSYATAHQDIASTISAFISVRLNGKNASEGLSQLRREVASTGELVAPIIASQEQAGFKHLRPPCDSDYPMPHCPFYPRYPSKQQGDTPQVNCTCGTPFVRDVAQPTMAGLPSVRFDVLDAIHSVSDTHPIHLPHIWNDKPCTNETMCTINSTTVTQGIFDALDGEDTGFFYTSASELRVKLKSRQSNWMTAGREHVNFTETDVLPSLCAEINQKSWEWALREAGPNAARLFAKIGQPLIMGKDVFIGNAGPEWIENPMQYNVASDGSHVEVRAPCQHTPYDYPIASAAGYHYCKVLSPARAMEWIYIDGLRARGSVRS